jgi:Outer membrane protein beta-barrel domain
LHLLIANAKIFSKYIIMKKILILVVMLLQFNLQAQHKWEVGTIVGINYSGFYLKASDIFKPVDNRRIATSRYGLFVEYRADVKVSLTAELNIDLRGENIFRYNYVSLPFIASYHFGKNLRWHTDAGMHLAIKTSGIVLDRETGLPSGPATGTLCPGCNDGRLDWGWIIGVGYQYPITDRLSVGFTTRLSTSITSIEVGPFGGLKNYAYSAVLGITYGFGELRYTK